MNRMAGDKPPRDKDELARLLFGPLVVLVLALLIGLIVASEARAHTAPSGWAYPGDCCAGIHCAPLPADQVRVTSEGYFIIPTGELIPFSVANTSLDGEYHYCTARDRHPPTDVNEWEPVNADDTLHDEADVDHPSQNRSRACFWAPDGAV